MLVGLRSQLELNKCRPFRVLTSLQTGRDGVEQALTSTREPGTSEPTRVA